MGGCNRRMTCVCGCKYYVTASQRRMHERGHSKKCTCRNAIGIRRKRTEQMSNTRCESHREHSDAGFFSSKVGLYVSPDGKEARIIDFSLEHIGSRHKTRRDGNVIVELQCNLSNIGCKEKRRATVQVKALKMWKPKKEASESAPMGNEGLCPNSNRLHRKAPEKEENEKGA